VSVRLDAGGKQLQMEPVALLEDLVLDKAWQSGRTIDLGSRGRLVPEGDDVAVYLTLEPSISGMRFFRREYRVGVLCERTARKVSARLESGCRYRVWVSDLPFPVHAPVHSIRVSIWMESDGSESGFKKPTAKRPILRNSEQN
jgi:hypothetical protein